MKRRSLFTLFAVECVLAAAHSALAQNPGGLPGLEHAQARVEFKHTERVVLHGDVVHYRFDVVVGDGEFDVIRIHRVVKETKIGRPERKLEGIMLLPGAPQLFEQIFMAPAASSVPPQQGSIALFLASNDIDVWGMDYGWSFVPYGTTDFTGLKAWGIDKDVRHTQIALSIARWMRATSGQGNGSIHLLGFSFGGFLSYAVASDDSQRPGNLKNLKGFLPVDAGVFKTNSATSKAAACSSLPALRAALDAGVYYSDSTSIMLLGRAALDHPDDPYPLSIPALAPYFPFVPPNTFTNYQAALASNVQTRFLGGTYAIDPPSVLLYYTYGPRYVRLLANTPPLRTNQSNYDLNASRCDSEDYPVAFDDHLGEITVPIFVIGRRDTGLYAATLTASGDISELYVNPAFDPALYGHADLFMANDAADVIWRPILNWIQEH